MADGKLRCYVTFYAAERDLYRKGAAAFEKAMEANVAHNLDNAGGIGPYVFTTEGDGNVNPFKLIGTEQ